ncbi:MAG TPA: hypothetical protein VNE18_10460 [Rhodanobacter sp.]|nr:hypothetical protein [Rhodanobacter sp.]
MKTSRVPLGKGMRVAVVRNGNTDTATFEELLALIGAKADTSALQFINGVPIDKIINANGTLNPTVVAQIYQSFLSESRKNRVPDSDLKFQSTYWTLSGLTITAAASPIGGNAFTFTGTGAASGNQSALSDIIDVTPGETVCLSGYIDATHCTVNAPFWAIYDITGVTQYAGASGVLGKAQRVSKKWLVPAGVTQVIVVPYTNNATVANATKVVFSEPQLESGDQASSYMPNLANDGTGYLKAGAAAVDLASAIHSNVNIDHIQDGPVTYGRPLLTRLSGGKPWIDFGESIHANKNLDYMGDGATYGSLPLANINGTGTSKRALIDLSQGHLNKTADNITYTAGGTVDSLKPAEVNAAAALKGLQNIIPQPAPDASNVVTGWTAMGGALTSAMYATNTYAPVMGYFDIAPGADVWVSRNGVTIDFTATGGDTVYAEGWLAAGGGTSVNLDLYILHADGSRTSVNLFSSTSGSWIFKSGSYTLPTDCVSYQVFIHVPAGTTVHAQWTNIVVGHDSRGLTKQGSGTQVGDARNTRGLTAAGVQYYLSGFGITATSTSISVTSGTIIMGGSGTGNTSYNSSSATGLTPSATYYLYYLDPGFAGGSKTLNATTLKTNLAQHPDAIYLGYWTTPASGSGGGGGYGGCVYENAWLDTADGSAVQAKDATQGLMLNAMSDAVIASATPATTPAPILNLPYGVLEPCVTISTASGSLTLSDKTPVNCKAGAFPAFDVLGEEVWTSLNGGSWEKITGVVYMQPCRVMRVSLGGLSYGAGDQPGYFIFTHNTLKP